MEKKIFYLLLQGGILLMCLFLWTCQDKENGEKELSSETKLEICLNVSYVLNGEPTVRSEDSNDVVKNLTIFIFNNATGNMEFAYYLDFGNPVFTDEVDISRWNEEKVVAVMYRDILDDLDRDLDIHVLANSEDFSERVSTLSELKEKLTTPITGNIVYGDGVYYTMHGEKSKHNFFETFRAEVNLERNIARIDLTINTLDKENLISFLPDDLNVVMQVINVADRSFLVKQAKVLEEVKFIAYQKEELLDRISDGDGMVTKTMFYVNENYLTEELDDLQYYPTAVVVQVPYKNVLTAEIYDSNYYKFYVNKNAPHTIDRNTIYRITVNIKDLGGETDLAAPLIEAELEVVDWNEENINTELS